MQAKLLALASILEIGTGLAVIVDPTLVVALLLGGDVSGVAIPIARCFGIALLALGLACRPGGAGARSASPPFRAMLIYNALIALFLVYLFAVEHLGGVLLWPGVALHAVLAMLLGWTRYTERPIDTAAT
ncbi:MAG: hypothetical protein ABI569_15055 [Casimicrobiaceae bacterium]